MKITKNGTNTYDFDLHISREELQYISDGLDELITMHQNPDPEKWDTWLTDNEVDSCFEMLVYIKEAIERG